MYYVYILHSKKLCKYYVGYTENPLLRLAYHNSDSNRIWTKRGQPWELIQKFPFETKIEALKSEKFIKNQKSSIFIEKIVKQGYL